MLKNLCGDLHLEEIGQKIDKLIYDKDIKIDTPPEPTSRRSATGSRRS